MNRVNRPQIEASITKKQSRGREETSTSYHPEGGELPKERGRRTKDIVRIPLQQTTRGRKEAAVSVISAHGMGQGEKSEHVLRHGETQLMDSEAEALVSWNPREHS